MIVSAVSRDYRKIGMRFLDPSHNSEMSDILDVLSRLCRHITRKSTWIFKFWLRFVKYRSPVVREWNLHEYGPVVAKLEHFEVGIPKTLTPCTFFENVSDSWGLVGWSRVVGSTSDLNIKWSSEEFGVTYVGILTTISAENASEAMKSEEKTITITQHPFF